MPDYRKTRADQPDSPLDLQYLTDPVGIVGQYPGDERPYSSGMDRLAMQFEPIKGMVSNDDAYKSPLQQIPEGLGLIGQSFGGLVDQAKEGLSNGLGMARQGLEAITPSRDTMFNIFRAMEAGGYPGARFQQMQADQGMVQAQQGLMQQQQMMNYRRQQLAQQLQQQREQKRQHDMGLLEKVMANPKASIMLGHLAEDPNFTMGPQALSLSKALKDSDYGSINSYREFIPEDIQKQFFAGNLPHEHLVAWIDSAREAAKENAKASAKSAILSRAMNKDAGSRTPYEQSIVEEHQAEIETNKLKQQKTQSEIEENKAQAALAAKKASGEVEEKPDHSVLNRVHQAMAGGLPFEKGSPQSQAAALDRYGKLYAMGRQEVELAKPAPVDKRSDVVDKKSFLQSGAMNRPPAGISQGDLAKGDFIQMSDKQQQDAQQIEQAKENLTSLMGLVTPHIKAKTPAEAASQFARLKAQAFMGTNPDLATYSSGMEAFSSVFARVFGGEVGVMTDRDINRWKATLPTFGDTKQVAGKKQELFFKLYDAAVMKFRKRIAGEDTSGENKQIEGLLSQGDRLSNESVVPKRKLQGMRGEDLSKKRQELFK